MVLEPTTSPLRVRCANIVEITVQVIVRTLLIVLLIKVKVVVIIIAIYR